MTSITEDTKDDYNSRTYDDLSKEFQTLFPSAIRAFQLVPLMYNRLTLVDNLSHSTVDRIYNDHHYMPGFSRRSITRYLPADNPAVPHRVRPSWPKNSDTQTDVDVKLSNNEQYEENIQKEGSSIINCKSSNKPEASTIVNENLELAGVQKIIDENKHLAEQVTILLELRKKYKAEINNLKQMISKGSFVTAEQISSKIDGGGNILFEFSVGVEDIKQYMSSVTANEGSFEILWFNGTLNKDMSKVIEICLGRMPTNNNPLI